VTFKGEILISWVNKSHEQQHLGRHSETPQNFSYYHAKLLIVLLNYSFHSTYKQCYISPRLKTNNVAVQYSQL